MKVRTISGVCYMAILVGFFALKIFVHDFCFDVLIYALALLGTHEIVRAMYDKMTSAERIVVYSFAAVCIPACAIAEYFFRYGLHVTSVCFTAMSAVLLSLLVIKHEETTPENLGVALFTAVYPTLLLMVLTLINHVSDTMAVRSGWFPAELSSVAFNSDLLILLVFIISPMSDCVAYLFGRFLRRKFPAKMAPEISPNKTVIGGIGGVVGGILSAVAIYFIYHGILGTGFVDMHVWLPVYAAIGVVGALATEFGDLVESCIKRKLGIKDMGKIMPGHGGVLDRIDGPMFAGLAVYLAFALIRLVV